MTLIKTFYHLHSPPPRDKQQQRPRQKSVCAALVFLLNATPAFQFVPLVGAEALLLLLKKNKKENLNSQHTNICNQD